MKNFLSFVNIDFLAGKDSLKNWRMLFFVSVLLMFTIYSSHSVDLGGCCIIKKNKEVALYHADFTKRAALKLQKSLSY